jgi:hypothetical protein
MDSTQRHLIDLLAELRERLRQFAHKPPGTVARPRARGALAAGERLALAARLLAEALGERTGDEAVAMAGAFQGLADALDQLPTPLAGSHLAADLEELVHVVEDLACAWDRSVEGDLPLLWQRVREAGDQLWPADHPPLPAAQDPDAEPAPAEVAAPPEVWLLVAGRIRRETLVRRLEQAGVTVACPADADALLSDLAGRRPDALLCDDAAPSRHHQRLRARLGNDAPPLVLVRGRLDGRFADHLCWTPPYRPDDLLALLDA